MVGFSKDIFRLKDAETKRVLSYDVEGRNSDFWKIEPKEKKVLAEIEGPGCITHIWMTQKGGPFLYREVLLKFYWDDEESPSILVPLGDFFCLGHSLVNSFCSLPFTASTSNPYKFGASCALNCYLPMPFKKKPGLKLKIKEKILITNIFTLIMKHIRMILRMRLVIFIHYGEGKTQLLAGEMNLKLLLQK